MSIFFTLSVGIHFITVHPKFHTKPMDIDPNDLGGSRRLLHKKVVVPGLHKTGPDRFDDCDRQVEIMNDTQDEMNDCLDEILRVLGGADPYLLKDDLDDVEYDECRDVGLHIEDGSASPLPAQKDALEVHMVTVEETEEHPGGPVEPSVADQDDHDTTWREERKLQPQLQPKLDEPVAQGWSPASQAPEPLVSPPEVASNAIDSPKLVAALDAKAKKAVQTSEPTVSEPSMTFASPSRIGNTGRMNLLRRLGVSSDRARKNVAARRSVAGDVAEGSSEKTPSGASTPIRLVSFRDHQDEQPSSASATPFFPGDSKAPSGDPSPSRQRRSTLKREASPDRTSVSPSASRTPDLAGGGRAE